MKRSSISITPEALREAQLAATLCNQTMMEWATKAIVKEAARVLKRFDRKRLQLHHSHSDDCPVRGDTLTVKHACTCGLLERIAAQEAEKKQ